MKNEFETLPGRYPDSLSGFAMNMPEQVWPRQGETGNVTCIIINYAAVRTFACHTKTYHMH